jgi:DNA-directed RNA polymerase specialized sigma24 family protein
MVERAIDRLPAGACSVLVLREIEGMRTTETAEVLDVDETVVKTRLHQARNCLREARERERPPAIRPQQPPSPS